MTFDKFQQFQIRSLGHFRRTRANLTRAKAMRLPFTRRASKRLLLVSMPHPIPQSQIFPFHHFHTDFARLYDAEIREVDLGQVLDDKPIQANGATTVAFQTPFDVSNDDLMRLIVRLRHENPHARLVFLDWCAPTDLRNAARLDPHIDLYVKKHPLRDRRLYGQPTIGDTNLCDHFNRRFGRTEQVRQFDIPDGFLSKLVVGPTFFTDPSILPNFRQATAPHRDRPIDVHARFETQGDNWYGEMRREAEKAIVKLTGRFVVSGTSVPRHVFLNEMLRSKLTFSPFGYGEVCWRDYEAVMAGAVLVKPDMSHIETAPNIFEAWQTYAPVRWDLTDLEETVDRLLENDGLRRHIALTAYARLSDYINSDAFARSMHRLFEDS